MKKDKEVVLIELRHCFENAMKQGVSSPEFKPLVDDLQSQGGKVMTSAEFIRYAGEIDVARAKESGWLKGVWTACVTKVVVGVNCFLLSRVSIPILMVEIEKGKAEPLVTELNNNDEKYSLYVQKAEVVSLSPRG